MPMAWYPISTRLGVSGKTPWGRLNKSGEVLAKDNVLAGDREEHRRLPLTVFAMSDVVLHEFESGWGLQIVTSAAAAWIKANVPEARWLQTTTVLLVDGYHALKFGNLMIAAGLLVRQAR